MLEDVDLTLESVNVLYRSARIRSRCVRFLQMLCATECLCLFSPENCKLNDETSECSTAVSMRRGDSERLWGLCARCRQRTRTLDAPVLLQALAYAGAARRARRPAVKRRSRSAARL